MAQPGWESGTCTLQRSGQYYGVIFNLINTLRITTEDLGGNKSEMRLG